METMTSIATSDTQGAGAVSIFSITQATVATFSDLFISQAFLCFIRTGSKRVVCPVNGEMIGEEGDLLIFPPGSIVTLENRPVRHEAYRAEGVYFAQGLVDAVYAPQRSGPEALGIRAISASPARPLAILDLIKATVESHGLPEPIRAHRLLEPLVWLQHQGIRLPAQIEDQPSSKLRRLIETDLSRSWRAADAADHFAMSEATLRRWLSKSGVGFSRILQSTRLERGLALLQTTDDPISEIAFECGFKTPSHFSDAFRRRFGIKPRAIRSTDE